MCQQTSCDCPRHTPAHRGVQHHEGGCCSSGHRRQFPTRDEIIRDMENYLQQIKAEAQGVEERIAELRKQN